MLVEQLMFKGGDVGPGCDNNGSLLRRKETCEKKARDCLIEM